MKHCKLNLSFLKWLLIAIAVLILALEACDNSPVPPGTDTAPLGTDAAPPSNAGDNTGGTTFVNAGSTSDTTITSETAGGDVGVAGAEGEDRRTASAPDKDADADETVTVVVDATVSVTEEEDAAITLTEDAEVAVEEPTAEEITFIEMYEDEVNSYDAATIDPLYDKLDAVPKEFLVGTWKGGVFEANAPNPQNWYGKRIYPDLTAEAWLTIAADGGPGPNNVIMGGGGLATIREEEFRGKSSAVLVYANEVVKDYFRKIRGDYSQRALGDIVIGFSTFENRYFHLTRTFL